MCLGYGAAPGHLKKALSHIRPVGEMYDKYHFSGLFNFLEEQ